MIVALHGVGDVCSVLAESLARIFLFARASEDKMAVAGLTGHSVAFVAFPSGVSVLPGLLEGGKGGLASAGGLKSNRGGTGLIPAG